MQELRLTPHLQALASLQVLSVPGVCRKHVFFGDTPKLMVEEAHGCVEGVGEAYISKGRG